MKAEQLKELGFKLIDEYVHGDNDEFVTQIFRKKTIEIDLNYNEKTKTLLNIDFCLKPLWVSNSKISFKELKQLDKILNK